MPISKLRNGMKKDVKLFLCLAAAGLVGFVPAYAGGITDILVSVFGFFILAITKGIVWILEMLSNLFLGAMSVDVNTLISNGYLKGFETFAEGIRIVATGIALAIVMWQLFVVLWGPLIGAQQTQSVMAIVMRGLIFVPLTYFIQPLALGVLKQFQSVYNAFLSVYNANPDGVFGVKLLSDYINPDTFMNDLGISGSNIVETTIQDILGTAMACIMIAVITWQFIKLLLELAQRFVAMLFYVYLSPLAAACGVGANSIQITKSALTLFISSGILWVLNVWSVSVCLGLFSAVDSAVGSGASGFFLWSVLTYGALKIAQQLDDIFNAVGATNVRLSGSLLDDIVSMTKMSEWAGKMYGGAQDALTRFSENGLGGTGKDPDKPVGPDGQGGAANKIPNNAMATAAQSKSSVQTSATGAQAGQRSTANGVPAANGMKPPVAKTAANGSPARSLGQQAGAKAMEIAGNTAAGRFVRGVKKTGENISTRVNAGVAEAQTAADNRAMARMNGALSQDSAENRAKAMAQLAKNHPADLNNQAVKDYLGENMGLAENQQIAGLAVDKNGQLSAMVATNNGDGSISMSKVSGINDMTFGPNANHSVGQDTQSSSAGSTTVGGSSAVTGGSAVSGGVNGTGGSAMAGVPQGTQISYKDLEGNSRTASVMKNEGSGTIKDGKPVASFSVIPDDGGSPVTISAPANMSEQDVASLVANTASQDVQNHFKQGGNEMQLAGSAARLSLDDTAPRSVNVAGGSTASGGVARSENAGSAENGMTQIRYSDPAGNTHTASVMREAGSETMQDGKQMATFTVTPDSGGNSVSISAPAGMTEQEVGSMVANTASSEVQARFSQGGDTAQLASSVAGLNIDNNAPRSVETSGSTAGGSASASSGHETAQINYSDPAGNTHTASVMREVGSETMQDGKQMATFTVTPDNGGNSVSISAPASMTEQEVGSMVANTASSEVQARFSQGGDTAQLASSVAGLNIDTNAPRSVEVSEPAAVGGGSASAGHETTQINYSGYDGNAHTASVMREVGSETLQDGKQMATFTVTPDNGGNSVSITAPASMTEQEVGSLVANSASSDLTQRFEQGGGSMSQVRDTTSHLDLNDSADRSVETSHISSTQSTSSETAHSVAGSVATAHSDGTMWTQEFTAQTQESPLDPSRSDLQFSYAQQQANGTSAPAAGFVRYESAGPDGQVQYQYGANNEVKGTITLDKNITAEELSALLMQKDGGGQAAVQEIRKNLGFTKEYSKPEADGFRDAMDKAKRMKKGVATSEEAPIKAEKK